MFAGELPFDSDDIEILKHAVTLDPVPGIVGESRAVNAVFAKVLAKKPQDRFDSCSAFVDALEGKKSALARSSQDWRFMVAGGLLVLAALSVAGWWLWYELVRSDELMFERARQVARAKRDAKQQEAEAARMAAEKAEAERKAKDVAQRIEEERRKDEEARRNAERDEAARKAKDEAERIVKEKARASEGERKRKLEDVVHRRSRNDKQLSREETQKAIELFKKGEWRNGLVHAENGDQSDPELQFWIGTCYDMGLGANCDAQKAIVHFRRAAEMGQVDAQCELGRRYESGLGVSQDLAQAKRWYQAAASRGSKSAEKNLRRLYDQESAALSEQALAQRASLSQRRREREEAARKERKTEQEREREAEKLREIKEELARLRESARNGGDGSALSTVRTSGKRQVSVSGRSSVRFTREDADTLAQLKFSSPVARKHYERACKLAREGAHNKTRVKSEYDTGRVCGGPEWPELEAWLDWWR